LHPLSMKMPASCAAGVSKELIDRIPGRHTDRKPAHLLYTCLKMAQNHCILLCYMLASCRCVQGADRPHPRPPD
jgi:hypothetical protein